MGLSLWNIFKVRQEVDTTTFWSFSRRRHFHFLMACVVLALSLLLCYIDRSINYVK
jgi:hypothetical protein